MKAATVARYGSHGAIEVRDVPAPVPGPGDVMVRVHAATVNRTDCGELRHPELIRLLIGAGRSRRRSLGMDFAGTVETVGEAVGGFKPGERVYGLCPVRNEGAQAEYFCMPETGPIARMPSNLRFDQAVVCEGAYYAHPIIEHFDPKPGHRILIYGASGAIGTAALQLARFRGAEITAVVAGRHLELVRSLGADVVIDYTTSAFDRLGRDYDFVLDAVGKMGISRWRQLLKPGGVFAATDVGPGAQYVPFLLWSGITGSGRFVVPLAKRGSGKAFVTGLRDKLEAGRFVPVIDRRYPLAAIADAYRYVQTGEKTGVVVIDVVGEDRPAGAVPSLRAFDAIAKPEPPGES
jgi:NADPH:quinone reductase-like Zn-dependent oxidoreductase